jgi:predicted transcriptional regulator
MVIPRRTQTLVQLTDELVALLDERAAKQRRSRSDLIREAVESFLGDDAEGEISRQIVAGYRRTPQGGDDLEKWARGGARDMIDEEPW